MDKNLALEFVRTTEAAVLNCGKFVGRGDKIAADNAAVEGMRNAFNNIDVQGTVVIGEGERDKAPMLFIGEEVGSGKGLEIDIAVDPLENTNSTARGDTNAIAVLAAAPKGTLLHAPDMYMDKIAVGCDACEGVDLDNSPEENIKAVAKSLKKEIEEVTVVIMDRERNKKYIDGARACGARIMLIRDGDVAGAIGPCLSDSGIDLLLGIGAAPEGVLAATAVKAMGGKFQGRLWPVSDEEIDRATKMGITDINAKLSQDDLVKTDAAIFAATGVTDGPMLKGLRYTKQGAITHSMVIRNKTKTVRFLETHHHFND